MPHQCAHWFAMTCKRQMGFSGCKGWFAMTPPPLSLRGAKRRGNPHLLRQHKTMRKYLRQIRRSCEFALSAAYCSVLLQGERIATPVCALVRNDMQKAVACQRLQGVVRNDMQKAVACQRLQGRWFAMTCKRRMRVCGCKNVGRNDMLKAVACQRLQGRWFAMTCRRQKRFCGCKGVTAFSTAR